ncbi:hypothetical protein GCM10023340_07690 [Nocardioides marinquilinus]|uniref:FAS1 domain-containing protein n=1 Tax=Nocardioides marinquilinus TaxID=1210400 RepID=A0ABP9PD87_9ACTN
MPRPHLHRLAAGLAGAVALTSMAAFGAVGSASAADTGASVATKAAPKAKGVRSLATLLAADKGFDRNGQDFDIAEAAIMLVLEERPKSPVGLVADGKQPLTVFVPTDLAFKRLVADLTGKHAGTEHQTVRKLTRLVDVKTLETVLLYHVVTRSLASPYILDATADRESLTTAIGADIGLRPDRKTVRLVDADPNDLDPRLVPELIDINRGNRQVAHGINRVLRPADL